MNKRLLIASMICGMLELSAQIPQRNDLFPLHIGSTWEYHGEYRDKMHIEKDTVIQNSRMYLHVEELPDDGLIVKKYLVKRNTGVFLYNPSEDSLHFKLFMPFEPKLGDTVCINVDDIYIITHLDSTFSTPLKQYDTVLIARGKIHHYTYFFKRGIGIIGKADEANKITHYLKKYWIGRE